MLHSIPEICKLTFKDRSDIYGMLNSGELSYVIGSDGKRKVETSELKRVFPNVVTDPEENVLSRETRNSTDLSYDDAQTQDYRQQREVYELRGMINDLKSEVENVLDDNRRLLRLLEYQAMGKNEDQKISPTEMAKGGWQEYKKIRSQDAGESYKANRKTSWLELLKHFFLKY